MMLVLPVPPCPMTITLYWTFGLGSDYQAKDVSGTQGKVVAGSSSEGALADLAVSSTDHILLSNNVRYERRRESAI
jgi:hypothetical protein